MEYKYRVHFDPEFGMSDHMASSPVPSFAIIVPDSKMKYQYR